MTKMDDLYPLIIESFNNNLDFTFPIHGTSMIPLLHTNDAVVLRKVDRELKRGDIVIYKRDNGQFVLHRIIKVCDNTFNIVGDHQTGIEVNVKKDSVIGYVISYKLYGKDKLHNLKGFKYNLYKFIVRFKLFRKLFTYMK